MKVGTDGVLLGAWAKIPEDTQNILDIGSGTGLIALMMAQRSPAELIDAVELDDEAYVQAVENFENSPWSDRLFCYHADFSEFSQEMDERYDLILSNPPYFPPSDSGDLTSPRKRARFTGSLSHQELIEGVSKLLSPHGTFCVIIPEAEKANFSLICTENKLHIRRSTAVKGTPESPVKRRLLEFDFQQIALEEDELIIELERHRYTDEYINLTKDFYLKM